MDAFTIRILRVVLGAVKYPAKDRFECRTMGPRIAAKSFRSSSFASAAMGSTTGTREANSRRIAGGGKNRMFRAAREDAWTLVS